MTITIIALAAVLPRCYNRRADRTAIMLRGTGGKEAATVQYLPHDIVVSEHESFHSVSSTAVIDILQQQCIVSLNDNNTTWSD